MTEKLVVEEEGTLLNPSKKNDAAWAMAGNIHNTAAPISSSLSKLQAINGLFAIYKKQGPTSADVLNTLKEVLLKGTSIGIGMGLMSHVVS